LRLRSEPTTEISRASRSPGRRRGVDAQPTVELALSSREGGPSAETMTHGVIIIYLTRVPCPPINDGRYCRYLLPEDAGRQGCERRRRTGQAMRGNGLSPTSFAPSAFFGPSHGMSRPRSGPTAIGPKNVRSTSDCHCSSPGGASRGLHAGGQKQQPCVGDMEVSRSALGTRSSFRGTCHGRYCSGKRRHCQHQKLEASNPTVFNTTTALARRAWGGLTLLTVQPFRRRLSAS
jgi:hypothetical protein